jgi:curved DNA-binding protein CbpA
VDREPHEILGVVQTAEWVEVRSAYLTLARRYHPDGSSPDEPRMAEINAAYDALERRRQETGTHRPPLTPVGPGRPDAGGGPSIRGPERPDAGGGPSIRGPERGSLLWRMQAHDSGQTDASRSGPEPGSLLSRMQTSAQVDSPTLDFGPYAGHTIAEVANHDPRYLRSISRQSRGLRYRRAIESALGPNP